MLYFAEDVLTFVGNTTHSDHFKLLREDGSSLLIGARNVVYNLTLADLTACLRPDLGLWLKKTKPDSSGFIKVERRISKARLEISGPVTVDTVNTSLSHQQM